MLAKIITTQDRMVYSVASEKSLTKRYRVDLLDNNGSGRCSCIDHGTRRQPFLTAGGDGFLTSGYCKHVRAARDHFLKSLLIAMAKSEEA